MASYFIDQEFIEGFDKPFFGKKRHFIDLISIGIVCDDGRSYYAISNEFKYDDASDWVKDNIIHKLPLKCQKKESISQFRDRCRLDETYTGMWYEGKNNQRIALEIQEFVSGSTRKDSGFSMSYTFHHPFGEIDFYGYFSDYDWVLFCSLFGTMMNLPEHFPKYCRDLKQTLDETALMIANGHKPQWNFEAALDWLKKHPKYPKQVDEHNALADAHWNKKLFDFIYQKQYAK